MNTTDTMLLPEDSIIERHRHKHKLLFVCSGNTCRSPMAAAMYNFLYRKSNITADSAGIAADGSPITDFAAYVLAERGVPVTADNNYPAHISRRVTEEDMEEADAVVAVSAAHATSLVMSFPAYATKITVMASNIPDPFGGDVADYRECLALIEKALVTAFGQPRPQDD